MSDTRSDPPVQAEQAAAWRASLDSDGYVVIPTGVPPAALHAVIEDIWRYTGSTPDDVDSWYNADLIPPPAGMVEMHHYQSMWDLRQAPSLHRIFSALHQTSKLWVSLDRISFKPPVRPDQPAYDSPGFIHWDTDINLFPDIPFHLQGVVALADADADMGGFQCVPDIYRDLPRFLRDRKHAGQVPRAPDIGNHAIRRVPLRAGEIAIWKSTLLHGSGRNTSSRPRLAQYIAMNPPPADPEDRERERTRRIGSWAKEPSECNTQHDQRHGSSHPASLTPLGRRLLGLDDWE